jgi:hypothetical protein
MQTTHTEEVISRTDPTVSTQLEQIVSSVAAGRKLCVRRMRLLVALVSVWCPLVVSVVTSSDAVYLISGRGIRDRFALNNHLKDIQSEAFHDIEVLRVYDNLVSHDLPKIPHYAARLSAAGLHLLQQRRDISYIEEDQVMSLNECITQDNPDWGLSRINQRGSFKAGTYAYEKQFAGAGVNIYIIGLSIPPSPPRSPSSASPPPLRHRNIL